MNGIAKFECQATGNPPPSVFWTKEGSQELMFAGTTHGQMFVSEEGTLTIQVNTSEYSCKIQITYMIWQKALQKKVELVMGTTTFFSCANQIVMFNFAPKCISNHYIIITTIISKSVHFCMRTEDLFFTTLHRIHYVK